MIKENTKLTSIMLPPNYACVIEIEGDRSILEENTTAKHQKVSIEFRGGETISIVQISGQGKRK